MGLSDHIPKGSDPFPKTQLPQVDVSKADVEPTKLTAKQKVEAFFKWARGKLSQIPLFGTLFSCSWKNYSGAFTEFFHVLFWSTMPFWLGGLVHYTVAIEQDKSLWDSFIGTFRNGELLVYVISTVTPTLYLAIHKPDGADLFPHMLPLSTIVTGIIVVSAVMFSIQKSAATPLDGSFIFSLSIALTVIGLILRYLALVYHRYRIKLPNEKEIRQGQNAFLDDYMSHRGAK